MKRIAPAILILIVLLFPCVSHAQMDTSIAILPVLSGGKTPVDPRLLSESEKMLLKKFKSLKKYKVVEAGPVLKKKKIKSVNILSEKAMKSTADTLGTLQIIGVGIQQKKSNRPHKASYTYFLSYYDAKSEMWIIKEKLFRNHVTYLEALKYLTDELNARTKGPFPLFIASDPEGADVVVENAKVGTTPYKVMQPPGRVTLKFMKTGRKEIEVSFTMPDDRPIHAQFPLKEDPNGTGFVPGAVAAVVPPVEPPKESEPPQKEEPPPPKVEEKPQLEPEPVMEPEPEPEPIRQLAPGEMTTQRKWAWRTVGFSVTFLAAGVIGTVAGIHYDDKSQDDSLLQNTRNNYKDASDASMLVGYAMYGMTAAALTTSLILFFTEDGPGSGGDDSQRILVGGGLTPEGAAVNATVKF